MTLSISPTRSGLTTTTDTEDARRKPPSRARDRAFARSQALARLAARHPDEFELLEKEERERVGLPPVDRGAQRFYEDALLRLIRANPAPGLVAAASATGLSTEGARQHLKRLVATGRLRLVPSAKTGRPGQKRFTYEVTVTQRAGP